MWAAVPQRAAKGFDGAPPGHRFRLYWEGWESAAEWSASPKTKEHALKSARALSREAKSAMTALVARQQTLAGAAGTGAWLKTLSTSAPLVTGLGMEHPIENGFAFLDPHGVPYLPGSSVKGALRRAAEELAAEDHERAGWTLSDVWFFFGFDATSDLSILPEELAHSGPEAFAWLEPVARPLLGNRSFSAFLHGLPEKKVDRDGLHFRGALVCWDALMEPPGDNLRIDIMTPHHAGYYKGDKSPSDDESPTPISFLTLPPETPLSFAFSFDPKLAERSPGARDDQWRELLSAALEHACAWSGFGAKTALGYGRLRDASASGGSQQAAGAKSRTAPETAKPPPAAEETWEACTVTLQPQDGTLIAEASDARKAEAPGEKGLELRRALPEGVASRLKKKKKLAGATVRVVVEGSKRTIVGLEVPE